MTDEQLATLCGKFGYETINENLHIPYIYNGGTKYCATKIFSWHFRQQNIDFPLHLTEFPYLNGYKMEKEEAALMNEINIWHNDSMYPFRFSDNDTIFAMDDVRDIFQFVFDCNQKEKLAEQYDMTPRAGMIQIRFTESNTQQIWPYYVKNGTRYIPSQCLEATFHPYTLRETVVLQNIEVMYMRYMYNVLKIDWPSNNFQVICILLDEAVSHLLSETNESHEYIDNYWPSKNDQNEPSNNNNLDVNKNIPIDANAAQNIDKKQTKPFLVKKRKNRKTMTNESKKLCGSEHYFDVDHLIAFKRVRGQEKVLVRWKNYSSEYDSWEPVSNMNRLLLEEVNKLRDHHKSNRLTVHKQKGN